MLLPTVYEDAGLSGGTLERPGLQRLLDDIDAGLVEQIVVRSPSCPPRKTDELKTRARPVAEFIHH